MKLRNKVGQAPLHCAALSGCWASAALLCNAAPEVASWRDRRDLTPAACAARRGHSVSPVLRPPRTPRSGYACDAVLRSRLRHGMHPCQPASGVTSGAQSVLMIRAGHGIASHPAAPCARHSSSASRQELAEALASAKGQMPPTPGVPEPSRGRTLVLAPPACEAHRTVPEPIVRGGSDLPPENVRRLHVLTSPGQQLREASVPPSSHIDEHIFPELCGVAFSLLPALFCKRGRQQDV